MPIVAVTGDSCTTTSVALAAGWPVGSDALLVEADPTGGDLAAWFDLPSTPSLSTVVTRVIDGSWTEIEQHTRLASSGLRVLTTPARAAEAQQAVTESARSLTMTLASLRTPVTIVDVGAPPAQPALHAFLGAAAVTVIVHRQATQSAPAAAVRLQRLAEQLEGFAGSPTQLVVAVIGGTPFALDEIERFVVETAGPTPVVGLPVDELAAATFAGRAGVSNRRLARLPLSRAATHLAAVVERSLEPSVESLWRSAR